MKKFILSLCFLAVSFAASAQYVDSDIYVKRGKVFSEGVKLTADQAYALFADLDGQDFRYAYDKWTRNYKTGAGLMIGGSVSLVAGYFLAAGGLVMILALKPSIGAACLITGGVMFYGGAGCFLAGIPVLAVNNNRLKTLADHYNATSRSSRPMELTFGSTSNGLGFALNF